MHLLIQMTIRRSIYTVFLFFVLTRLAGQSYKPFIWEGAVFVGTAMYSGDITPGSLPALREMRPALGAYGRIPLSQRIGLRTGVAFSFLTAKDAHYAQRASRGYSFHSEAFDLTVIGEFEPLGRDRFYVNARGQIAMDRLISPYVAAGLGLAFVRVSPDFSQMNQESLQAAVRADLNKGSSFTTPVLPIGLGVKWDVKHRYSVAVESILRLTASDYIDGISKAAGPHSLDTYLVTSALFYYRF